MLQTWLSGDEVEKEPLWQRIKQPKTLAEPGTKQSLLLSVCKPAVEGGVFKAEGKHSTEFGQDFGRIPNTSLYNISARQQPWRKAHSVSQNDFIGLNSKSCLVMLHVTRQMVLDPDVAFYKPEVPNLSLTM